MSDYVCYYKILGLKFNSSSEEVKKAYRNLVKIWHPDRFPNNSVEQKQAAEKFKKLLKLMKFSRIINLKPRKKIDSSLDNCN
ncbi:MAG: J domain-containing protein [Hydrococcus sp. CRU_1_1]|nr:J domain-containing protein [Hydrococcus sp. CRU_1_1]